MSGFSLGSLRHRVVLERPLFTPDGAGGESMSHEPVRSVWARVRPRGRGHQGRAGGDLAASDYTITVRRWTDIAPGWRVIFEDVPLEIERVEPVFPRLLYVRLQCRGGGG